MGGCSSVEQAVADATGLSLDDIVSGLMEALEVAAEKAVSFTGKEGGFGANDLIKIGIPDAMMSIMDKIRSVPGLDDNVDDFIKSMNTAAEQAASECLSIFVDAIKKMNFDDAKAILEGGDGAATKYFKNATRAALKALFGPICQNHMEDVERLYNIIVGAYNAIPFVDDVPKFDISDYVTDRALDGVFSVLEEQENDIRNSDAARGSDLLKKVFSDENQKKPKKE